MSDSRDAEHERHDRHEHTGSRAVGAVAGGVGGMVAGAGIGILTGGPIGSIIGALAGAVGGGWAGLAAGEGIHRYESSHDEAYRAHYEESPHQLADRSFEQVRPAYQLGHLAATNRDYLGRSFDEIEPELQRGWLDELHRSHGEWEHVKHFARHAYERASGRERPPLDASIGQIDPVAMTPSGETATHERPSYADPIPPGDPDHVLGEEMPIPGREER